MIVSIGEAVLASGKPASEALCTAFRLVEKGASVLLCAPVSSGEDGMEVLEYLIDNGIFFDPAFCNMEQPGFPESKLEMLFRLNSDIDVVCIGGQCLESAEVVKTLSEVLGKQKNVKICLDVKDRPALAETELYRIAEKKVSGLSDHVEEVLAMEIV